jgi:hypothetical protein
VTGATNRPVAALPTQSASETAGDQPPSVVVPGLFRRGVHVVVELLAAAGVVLCIPIGILAIGIPIALCVRFLLWLGSMI